MREDDRKSQYCHDRRILLCFSGNGRQEGEDKAQAPAAKQDKTDELPRFLHGITQEHDKEQETQHAHDQHEQGIKKQFGKNKADGTGDGIEIQHPSPVLLQETFGDSIDTDKELDHPEQPVPDLAFRLIQRIEKHKNGGADIEQHPVKTVLLPYFQQYILFQQGKYVFGRIDKMSLKAKILIMYL